MTVARCIVITLCLQATPALSADMQGYVFVNEDGSLRLRGKTVHLYGIHIPPTDDSCRTFQQPVLCAPRAALALEFNIGSHFVGCDVKAHNEDGSLAALCHVEDQDLAAQLLQQGWAVARPEAPFEYHTLEKLARYRGVGIWGLPVVRPR